MFRYLTAIILLTAFTAQTFHSAFIVINYYTNTAAFAKNCENKARPMMHCNGKCQMMKKLKAEENRDQQNPERKFENKTEVLSSKSFFATLSLQQWNDLNSLNPDFISMPLQDISLSIFHPPTA